MEALIPNEMTMTVLKRLLVALILGGLIGYERELHHKPAGFRTHILVSLGSALFTIVSIFGFGEVSFANEAGGVAIRDTARVAAQVVVGIGFLAAGIIIQNREADGSASVKGLTTAASIWVVAAVGMSVGAGMIATGVFATILLLIILVVLDWFETYWIKRWQEVHLVCKAKNQPHVLSSIMRLIYKRRGIVQAIDVKDSKKGAGKEITLQLILPPKVQLEDVTKAIIDIEGVQDAKLD